jgi:hypothetical protein
MLKTLIDALAGKKGDLREREILKISVHEPV